MPNTPPRTVWQTSRFDVDLTTPKIMGIVNLTPDSFSDGGKLGSVRLAVQHCEQLLSDGAHLLDLGGESTRPGAVPVSLADELNRVLPVVVEAVKLGVPVSIDTNKPEVMRACLDLGVDIVNDVWALRQPGALAMVARHSRCGVCLMHMHGQPESMQVQPMAGEAMPQVLQFLKQRTSAMLQAGVAAARLVLDPGVGFGKTVQQNFSLLALQTDLVALGFPLLVGWSRKSSLGAATGRENPQERLAASVAAALLAVERGARVVRVHDVRETADALKVWQALQDANSGTLL